jgi:hypothetical protein
MKLHGEYEYNQEFANKLSLEFTASYSDKGSHHGYHEVYSHLLAGMEPKSFLEIGLFLNNTQHTDLFAWEQVFPNTNIYGADWGMHLLFERNRIKTFFVDQSKDETFDQLIKSLPEQVDLIIDDASHIYELSIKTFEKLYHLIPEGGIYMIEDILFGQYNLDSWEQRVSQFTNYFDGKGFDYEVFATSKVHDCVDSVVLAVYK